MMMTALFTDCPPQTAPDNSTVRATVGFRKIFYRRMAALKNVARPANQNHLPSAALTAPQLFTSLPQTTHIA
jgi:hypothetical protein